MAANNTKPLTRKMVVITAIAVGAIIGLLLLINVGAFIVLVREGNAKKAKVESIQAQSPEKTK